MNYRKPLLGRTLPATKPSQGRRRGTKRRKKRRETKRHRRRRESKRHRRRRGTKRRKRRRWCRPEKQGRILHLPDDILLLIFDVLDYTSAIILTRVHPRFWNLVNPATFYSQKRKSADIEHAQHTFTKFKGRLACYGCFRLLSTEHFGKLFTIFRQHRRLLFKPLKPEQKLRFRCDDRHQEDISGEEYDKSLFSLVLMLPRDMRLAVRLSSRG